MKRFLLKMYFRIFGNPGKLGRALRVSVFSPEIRKISEKKILDVACGDGTFASIFSQDNDLVVGLDLHLLRHKDLLPISKKCIFLSGDIRALPFPDEIFDFILCIQTIEHIPQYQTALRECSRVLRPGGTILIETCEGPWQSPIPLRKWLLKLPKPFSRLVMGPFYGLNEIEFNHNVIGHINLDITARKLSDELRAVGIKPIRINYYFNALSCLLYEIWYSIGFGKLRYVLFPLFKLIMQRDSMLKTDYNWNFYIVGTKQVPCSTS